MKTVIEMAREAGWQYADDDRGYEPLWRFASLVAAAEREACAKVCEDFDFEFQDDSAGTLQGAAEAVRARGPKLKPCRSPYCECDHGKCSHPGFYDARGEPWPPAQQEPVAKVCHDLDGHIGWNPNLRQLPDEGTALYTSPPTLSLAQRPHECSRSHPHENMNAMCELRTEIARLTNENARLKAQQHDPVGYLYQGISHHTQGKKQFSEKQVINLEGRWWQLVGPVYTSPPAQRTWVGLTDWERNSLWRDVIGWGDPSHDDENLMKAIEAKLKEKNT